MARRAPPTVVPEAPVAVVRKGRGALSNIAHRFDPVARGADESLEAWPGDHEDDAPGAAPTEVTLEQARTALSYNDSPDIGFDRALNPYRGCEHGCVYCYARPTHSYLNLSPGLDFERRLVAKPNLAERLRDELARPGYVPAPVTIGSATDAYQPVERRLRITRAVLEVLGDCRHPYSIVTKGALVERDVDLVAPAAADGTAAVFVSVTSLDAELSRHLEPRAASPERRLRTVEMLARAGIPVHVNVAPIIPFVNEPDLERVIEAVAARGARGIHFTVLRLPWEVNPLFQQWLETHLPDRAERVMSRVREMRGGRDYDATFGERMKGTGVWAQLIRSRVERACRAHGLTREGPALRCDRFAPPAPRGQGALF